MAHELGHILLGHKLKIKQTDAMSVAYTEENIIKERKKTIEIAADMFALRALAPACVLWGLNITEAEDIMTLCGICRKESNKRAKRMAELYTSGKFLTSDLEKQMYEQFKPFIE